MRRYYAQEGKSLDYIVRNRLNFEDDFDDDWGEEGTYCDPYFVYKDDTKEPCGYILYELKGKNGRVINNIVLFSFNLGRKDFGK